MIRSVAVNINLLKYITVRPTFIYLMLRGEALNGRSFSRSSDIFVACPPNARLQPADFAEIYLPRCLQPITRH